MFEKFVCKVTHFFSFSQAFFHFFAYLCGAKVTYDMTERKQITFDSFIRSVMGVILAGIILWLLNLLSNVLTPFFVAWLIAYLLFPVVKFFQYRCHLKYRILGILCTFLVTGLIIWLGFLLIIPPMIEESIRVKDLLLEYMESDVHISTIPQQLQEFIDRNPSTEQIKAIVTHEGFIDNVKQTLPKIWDVMVQSFSVISGMLSMTMIILYTLFILLDYEQFTQGWPDLLPARWRKFAQQLVSDVEQGMNKYFRGQALVAFCVGVLFSIGFLIIDFPMAIGLGMLIGLLNMVPYLQLAGFIPTILLAIVKSADTGQNFWIVLLMALAVFAVVQVIQDTIITPKIMGKVMGLNSAIILLSLSIWGSLLGILGMVIALPMTTLLLTYYQRYVIKTKTTKMT